MKESQGMEGMKMEIREKVREETEKENEWREGREAAKGEDEKKDGTQ